MSMIKRWFSHRMIQPKKSAIIRVCLLLRKNSYDDLNTVFEKKETSFSSETRIRYAK